MQLDSLKGVDFTGIAVLAGGAFLLYSAYAASKKAGAVLDDTQLAVSDGLAEISGLADYERALWNAKTPEEVRAIRAAWESRPWYRRIF
jgi:hypothetical protein